MESGIKVEGDNKWLTIIQHAQTSKLEKMSNLSGSVKLAGLRLWIFSCKVPRPEVIVYFS